MPFQIGQCCVDQIINPDPVSPDASGKNEIVPFSNLSTLVLPWNNTRKNRFGEAAVFIVELIGDDGKYRPTSVQWVPDNILNTTSYTFDFGGPSTGRIIIS